MNKKYIYKSIFFVVTRNIVTFCHFPCKINGLRSFDLCNIFETCPEQITVFPCKINGKSTKR